MKKLFAFFVVTIAFFSNTQLAKAHELATDKNIGALLHIEPNDEPLAGQQATFIFEFKDKEGKFTMQQCDCKFVVSKSGKDIFSQPLSQNSTSYTFVQKGVYQIKVIGKPITPHAFQSFTLMWDFQIDKEVQQQKQNKNFFLTHNIHFLAIGIFLIFFLVYFVKEKLMKKKQ